MEVTQDVGDRAAHDFEWDLDYTNRAGRMFHNSGVTSGSARGGKIVRLQDYLFDWLALAEANAPESDAPA